MRQDLREILNAKISPTNFLVKVTDEVRSLLKIQNCKVVPDGMNEQGLFYKIEDSSGEKLGAFSTFYEFENNKIIFFGNLKPSFTRIASSTGRIRELEINFTLDLSNYLTN